MKGYVARRLALAVGVVIGVLVVTFVLSHVVPSHPARLYAGGQRATAAEVADARRTLGLDRPLVTQFTDFVANAARGDFGDSFESRRPVTTDLREYLPKSFELIIPAMIIALVLGIPIGLLAGARPRGRTNRAVNVVALVGAALPAFWLALIGQLFFAVWFHVLPVGGVVGTDTTLNHPIANLTGFSVIDASVSGNWSALGDSLKHMVLPVLVLSVYPTALVVRQTSASVSKVMTAPFVTALRAYGLPERRILLPFVLKNAIMPTLTVLGLTFAGSLTGVVLVETIFAWPGIGNYLTTAILSADYPVILAVTIIGAMAYAFINLVVDLVQAAIDPRIRLTRGAT
jgi:peptide/nickel transport system permease protein